MAIVDLISQVHFPCSVNMLPKYLKHFKFSSCFWSIVIVTGDGCLESLITFFFHINFHAIVSTSFLLLIFCLWRYGWTWARASSFLRVLHHIQRCSTVCKTPLDERSARSRVLSPKTHNNHNSQTTMPLGGFKPKTSASERPQTHTLDHQPLGPALIIQYVLFIPFFDTISEDMTNCFATHSSPTWGKYFMLFPNMHRSPCVTTDTESQIINSVTVFREQIFGPRNDTENSNK